MSAPGLRGTSLWLAAPLRRVLGREKEMSTETSCTNQCRRKHLQLVTHDNQSPVCQTMKNCELKWQPAEITMECFGGGQIYIRESMCQGCR